ncbi:hypothetical protein B9479_007408 [Cryptococcus floricola]|uniref:Uncharacterized protein n=1 Tax=Cryptococcus floricola TaxID=2591691 RepID=A0A5D3AKG9_9TREE|nr:hypothetical protein B9479_007408 [Cryptococcus floricola]
MLHFRAATDRLKDMEEDCYIAHPDDHGGHVMIDDEGRVTGLLIGTGRAYTTSKEEAFECPQGLMDVDAFYAGSNSLSEHEVTLPAEGRPDLAQCVEEGSYFYRRPAYA